MAAMGFSAGTTLTLLQRYPKLLDVIGDFAREHDVARELDEDVAFDDLYATFKHKLEKRRRQLEGVGLVGQLPNRVAIGWFCQMKKALSIRGVAVASTETRRVADADHVIL